MYVEASGGGDPEKMKELSAAKGRSAWQCTPDCGEVGRGRSGGEEAGRSERSCGEGVRNFQWGEQTECLIRNRKRCER